MSSIRINEKSNNILFLGFNQDYKCFTCGTSKGFMIYNADPMKEMFRRTFNRGISYVEMLFCSNIIALIGGGTNPQYPPNKVMIWDDSQKKCIGELCFQSNVLSVRLRRDKVLVILPNKVYLYEFSHLKLMDHIMTSNNPNGLCSISFERDNTILSIPGLQNGYLRVQLYDKKAMHLINCHESQIAMITLNFDGSLLATASKKGTLIRIWNTLNGKMIKELRRGTTHANIISLAFSPKTSKYLVCSSDTGTIHIFEVKDNIEKKRNNKTKLFKFKLPSFVSGDQHSFAQLKINEKQCIVGFSEDEKFIIVIASNGTYYKAAFNIEKGSECKVVTVQQLRI